MLLLCRLFVSTTSLLVFVSADALALVCCVVDLVQVVDKDGDVDEDHHDELQEVVFYCVCRMAFASAAAVCACLCLRG